MKIFKIFGSWIGWVNSNECNPRKTNSSSCSRQQNGGSGGALTAQEQQTNNARASSFTGTARPSKENNTSNSKIIENKF